MKASLARQRLREGTRLRDLTLLRPAYTEFLKQRLPEKDGDVTAAARVLETLKSRDGVCLVCSILRIIVNEWNLWGLVSRGITGIVIGEVNLSTDTLLISRFNPMVFKNISELLPWSSVLVYSILVLHNDGCTCFTV